MSYLRKSYLLLYNAASAVAWATVLGRVIAVFLLRGPVLVPAGVDTFVRNTQSFAALEIIHSLLGAYPSFFALCNWHLSFGTDLTSLGVLSQASSLPPCSPPSSKCSAAWRWYGA